MQWKQVNPHLTKVPLYITHNFGLVIYDKARPFKAKAKAGHSQDQVQGQQKCSCNAKN